MNRQDSEWRLLMIWSGGAVVVFAILLMQHLNGALGPNPQQAWAWFATTVMATPAVLLGSYTSGSEPQRQVDARAARFVLWLSVIYLMLVVVAVVRFGFQSSRTAVDLLLDSTMFLAPVQTFVNLAFGRFFGIKTP